MHVHLHTCVKQIHEMCGGPFPTTLGFWA